MEFVPLTTLGGIAGLELTQETCEAAFVLKGEHAPVEGVQPGAMTASKPTSEAETQVEEEK